MAAGEDLAMGTASIMSAENIVNLWMNSPAHRHHLSVFWNSSEPDSCLSGNGFQLNLGGDELIIVKAVQDQKSFARLNIS